MYIRKIYKKGSSELNLKEKYLAKKKKKIRYNFHFTRKKGRK